MLAPAVSRDRHQPVRGVDDDAAWRGAKLQCQAVRLRRILPEVMVSVPGPAIDSRSACSEPLAVNVSQPDW